MKVIGFPNPVDEISARLVAAGVVVLSGAYVVTGWTPLVVVLALGFLARVLTGPTLSPLGQLVTRVVRPALPVEPRPTPGPPKRFAQGIGVVFSTTAAVLALAFDQTLAAGIVLGVLTLFATLEAALGFCAGCFAFGHLMRLGVIPEETCEACADISLRQRVPTA